MYKDTIAKEEETIKTNNTGIRRKMIVTFKWLREIIVGPRIYGDADDEADDEQLDTTNMHALESEESAEQGRNQEGQGLKILTPNQMLSRLPISFAQLKAGNNSEKLKNEITQLLYSFYRSKKLSKTIYKYLINII